MATVLAKVDKLITSTIKLISFVLYTIIERMDQVRGKCSTQVN